MASLKRALEHSLIAQASPEYNCIREDEIANAPNPVKRTGLQLIQGITKRYPRQLQTLLGLEPLPDDFTYVGKGSHSVAFRDGADSVLKVNLRSPEMSDNERSQLARAMERDHGLFTAYMGEVVVPHTVSVAMLPWFNAQHPAVHVGQSYCDMEFLQLWVDGEAGETELDLEERIHAAAQNAPTLIDTIGGAIEDGRALYRDHALTFDILGENVGIEKSTRRFRTIDGQPVTVRHPEAQREIAGHLDVLEQTVQRLAA